METRDHFKTGRNRKAKRVGQFKKGGIMNTKALKTNEKQEIKSVLASLKKAGIKVSTGNVNISNKPTINSNH